MNDQFSQLGFKPSNGPTPQTPQPTQSSQPQAQQPRGQDPFMALGFQPAANQPKAPDNRDFLQKTGDIVNKFFPGAKVGQGIENSIAGIGDALKGDFKGAAENADANGAMAPQIFGDAANAALTAGSFAVGGGESALSRIGTNTALGAGMGVASSVANGETDPTKIAEQGAFGGGTGLASGVVGEAANKLISVLPKRIVQAFMPKLQDGTIDYALQNMKMGSLGDMVEHSNASLESYNNQIKSILSHPDNAGIKIGGNEVMDQVLSDFPHSEYTADDIFAKMKSQVPSEAATITKLQKGEALSLDEANTLRQATDKITYKTKIDSPEVKAGKDIAASFGNALRNRVQTLAPETQPIFDSFSKEINLNKSLNKLKATTESKKAIGFYDLVAGGLGAVGGVPGMVGSVALEKALRSPVVNLVGAKALDAATPAIQGAIKLGEKTGAQAGKIPVTN